MLLFNALLFAAPRIASYRAQIHSMGEHRFSVDIAITTGGEAWTKPAHSLERYEDERLLDEEAPAWHVDRVGLLDRLISTEPRSAYGIHYVVEESGSGLARVPLAVPDIPTNGKAGSVTITFFPPSGEDIAGDSFPAFQRNAAGLFVAELANVPNHVQLAMWRTSEAGFRERWVTPATLSDLAVITLLVLGSIGRAVLRRREK